jgi:hypothetical protein
VYDPGNGIGSLGADTFPVRQTILVNTQFFGVTGSNRVIEADTLDETTVTTIAGIGYDDVVEGALPGTATGKTNGDHVIAVL